ncbi:MAG: tRNA pseudouridine(38-40) synthase TruA [Clostridiales bacterium]|nr:tRNA pseudouridine(38-40) synthase TruA [Clostridiales bacterium]
MRNLLLTLRFDGAPYHGWQVQKNGISVQETVQDAIEKVTGVRSGVIGCSRTDAGVHAEMYCCNFRTDSGVDTERMIYALNANLPDSIGVYGCREVPEDFHARYSCVSKKYVYKIWNSPFKNPFLTDRYYMYGHPLDEKMLDEESKYFLGKHDYRGFASSGCSVKDTVRTVFDASVERRGDEVFFTVEADGFLYNMVRIMTGTLFYIQQGKIERGALPEIIESGERERAGVTAPACGLYLRNVNYGG